MTKITSVDFIGLGAMGIMYGDFFEQALGSKNVRFWADRKRVERYRKSTFTCNGRLCSFQYLSPDQAKEASQLLFFAVKSLALNDAIELARPIVDQNTIIVSLLNGITSEEIIENSLGTGRVIRCVAQKMDSLKDGNNVTYRDIGELCIGITDQSERMVKALAELEEFFDSVKLPYVHDADINHRLWCKWMLNVGINQTLMVFEGTFDLVQKPGKARDTFIGTMKEVQALSNAAGINITDDEFNEYLRIADALNPDGMPSMRQDGLNHRKSEVALFAQTAIQKGRELGVATPYNDWLFARVKEMESKY